MPLKYKKLKIEPHSSWSDILYTITYKNKDKYGQLHILYRPTSGLIIFSSFDGNITIDSTYANNLIKYLKKLKKAINDNYNTNDNFYKVFYGIDYFNIDLITLHYIKYDDPEEDEFVLRTNSEMIDLLYAINFISDCIVTKQQKIEYIELLIDILDDIKNS